MPKTSTTKQGFDVDTGIVDFISHLNDCGWLSTMQSCSGLEEDHDGKFHIPHVTFHGKTLAVEGGKEDKSTLLNKRPTPDDIELINKIQEAGWFHNLHFMLINAGAYPRFLGHGSSTSPDRTSNLRMDYIANLFAHAIEDTSDEEKIEKWKDLVAVLSSKFCPEKNPYPNRGTYVTRPTKRRQNDFLVTPRGIPKSGAREIYDKLLQWM